MESEAMGLFTVESVTTFARGEVLVCCCDTRNRHDPFAVATCKGMTVVARTRMCVYNEVYMTVYILTVLIK